MNDEQQGATEPQSPQPTQMQPQVAPPTVAVPYQAPKSSWPTVVGVIGIIYAGMGLFSNMCGVVIISIAPQFIEWLQNMGMSDADAQEMKASLSITTWLVVGGLIGLAVVIMLLVGSIKLLKRKQSGAKLCKLWAWISIPWILISTFIGVAMQTSIQDSSAPAEQVGAIVGAIIGISFGLILPVFMVIWFARSKIKSEITSWSV